MNSRLASAEDLTSRSCLTTMGFLATLRVHCRGMGGWGSHRVLGVPSILGHLLLLQPQSTRHHLKDRKPKLSHTECSKLIETVWKFAIDAAFSVWERQQLAFLNCRSYYAALSGRCKSPCKSCAASSNDLPRSMDIFQWHYFYYA
eukprot:6487061-Amphidinium_carterae.2